MRRDGQVESCLGCKIALKGCSELERVRKDRVGKKGNGQGPGRPTREPHLSVAQRIPMNGYMVNSGTLS
jgi:hypothetical protein